MEFWVHHTILQINEKIWKLYPNDGRRPLNAGWDPCARIRLGWGALTYDFCLACCQSDRVNQSRICFYWIGIKELIRGISEFPWKSQVSDLWYRDEPLSAVQPLDILIKQMDKHVPQIKHARHRLLGSELPSPHPQLLQAHPEEEYADLWAGRGHDD